MCWLCWRWWLCWLLMVFLVDIVVVSFVGVFNVVKNVRWSSGESEGGVGRGLERVVVLYAF